ncbi:5-deoxy-glucuronate isomerase [Vallitalea okinawensis]|uniref:5-deoxy-glucuronate isomerase n=1 Tax=Vallitalea okinawensis TaxID=2078660 RepID=UPI000CFCE460|nr:5-deoxy-glucuronate isomerase [Vallitalea okinawensis]
MIVKQTQPFEYGYNSISEINGKNSSMLMDFGIIRFKDGMVYENEADKERTFLLIQGKVTLKWEDKEEVIERNSCFDENPWCLHVPRDVKVTIEGLSEAEVAYQAVYNDNAFVSKLYTNKELRSEQFGAGTLGETATRTVRTVIDDSIAPYSNLVIGEVINHPGKWSSYPPHHHPQPEIYYYRFTPEMGFGYSEHGDEVFKVRHNDTALIEGGNTHSQTAAPGYAMYYLWLIPHLKDARFNDRIFVDEHKWLLDKDAVIWPNK